MVRVIQGLVINLLEHIRNFIRWGWSGALVAGIWGFMVPDLFPGMPFWYWILVAIFGGVTIATIFSFLRTWLKCESCVSKPKEDETQ